MKRLMYLVSAFLTALAVCLVLLWIFQRRLLYIPLADVPRPGVVGLSRAEEIRFVTADGVRLLGWFVPASRSASGYTVIVFNGNAGNRSFRASLAARLSELGHAVLLFDYRGYGGSGGYPTEPGLAADARASVAYLASRGEIDPARLVYFGESLGTGVAIALAVERVPAAIILRSPYTSMIDVGALHYPYLPVRRMLWDRYPSLDRAARVACPVLVIAGDRDRIIPIEQSRRLYEALAGPKRLITIAGADHNDAALLDGDDMMRAIAEFLQTLGVSAAPS